MSSRPLFRFIHASNLELDRFCSVEGEPDHDQRRLLIDAPFRAAERVFETALREQAELIILAGGTFAAPRPSTWGASFLARQCERAGRHGISVYWAESSSQWSRGWPRFLPLPANLICADPQHNPRVAINLSGRTPVELLCSCDPAALQRSGAPIDAAGVMRTPLTIGVQPRPDRSAASVSPSSGGLDVDYRAVQGESRATVFPASHGMARSAGTTQPRSHSDAGVGGCLLVEVGPGFSLGTRFLETNALRYQSESITVDDSMNWEGFRRTIHARTDDVLRQTTADCVTFKWVVRGHGPVLDRLIRPAAAEDLRTELRTTFGTQRPTAWIADLDISPDAVLEARWQREAGLFGAFVRTLDGLPTGGEEDIDLAVLGRAGLLPQEAAAIDTAARHVARPHFQTAIKAGARRQAADVLADLPR